MEELKMHNIAIYRVEQWYDDPITITPSSWETVNEEELEKLRKYCIYSQNNYNHPFKYFLIEQIKTKNFKLEISDIIRQAEEYEIKEAKRIETNKKRQEKIEQTKQKKKEEKERKLLEKLKEKYD